MTARFEIRPTPSGYMTAVHCEGTLVHSAQNPFTEAEAIAELIVGGRTKSVVLVGNGLGYLSASLSRRGVLCASLELLQNLHMLSQTSSDSVASKLCDSAESFYTFLTFAPSDSEIIIAPYVISLRSTLSLGLRTAIEELHVTLQSQRVYRRLIDLNIMVNKAQLPLLPQLNLDWSRTQKTAVAVGSGPTLEASIRTLVDWREDIFLVAASGAAPVLSRFEIVPDWIIALEARDAIIADMDYVKDDSKVLVFPWTHPHVAEQSRFSRVLASEEHQICTSGGSTGLAAADFAAKQTRGAIFLIGMDMSNRRGEYSTGVERTTANAEIAAPKFGMMRDATSRWIAHQDNREVFHTVMPGEDQIHGARRLYPMELATALARERNSMLELSELIA